MQTRSIPPVPRPKKICVGVRSTIQYIENKLMADKTATQLDLACHNNPIRGSRLLEFFSLEPGSLPNLTSITCYNANLSLYNLLTLLMATPNLTTLNLGKVNYSREDVLDVLAKKGDLFNHLKLNRLRVIDISDCNMIDSDLSAYAAGRNICVPLLGFLLQASPHLEELITNSQSITFKNELYHIYTALYFRLDHKFAMRELVLIYEHGLSDYNRFSGQIRVLVEKDVFLARNIYSALYHRQLSLFQPPSPEKPNARLRTEEASPAKRLKQ